MNSVHNAFRIFAMCVFFVAPAIVRGQPDTQPCSSHDIRLQRLKIEAKRSLNLEPELDNVRRRARLSSLLPEVEAKVYFFRQRQRASDIEETFNYENENRAQWEEFQNTWDHDREIKRVYRIGAEWEFSELLYSEEELGILSQKSQAREKRLERLNQLTELYFKRKSLCRQTQRASGTKRQKLNHSIQLIEAKINNLTGNYLFERKGGQKQ